ncbi:major facilitator superfamily domain-containing protein [Xylariales sp. PMI_506]|nr:major facilitator superfamily domain-containing protein [Xylariales sp. PMI_506]
MLGIEEFLQPLQIDVTTVRQLAHELCDTYRHLAVDGGTNLRVGFIELLGIDKSTGPPNGAEPGISNDLTPITRLHRVLEKSWPILEHLKNEKASDLFAWIGECIANVVRSGCEELDISRKDVIPLGVAFSFPMEQQTLSQATLMAMGKGFAISSNLDLGSHLLKGYEAARSSDLPPLQIAAIANDAVATLVSFIYQSQEDSSRKASMAIICGTGCNATIPLRKGSLHRAKLPQGFNVLAGDDDDNDKIAVNTEWTINGTAPALRKFGLITRWDEQLDAQGEAPGFQPLEYMTSGRYLGELARLILVDYLANKLRYPLDSLPDRLKQRFGLTTTYLSHFKPPNPSLLVEKLNSEYPIADASGLFQWNENIAVDLYRIAKTIEIRAAGIIAAATIGLLGFSGDLILPDSGIRDSARPMLNGSHSKVDLIVGYTGGCITHFQDYLIDCQNFLDHAMEDEPGRAVPVRIVLRACHDGGITGAGVLAGSSLAKLANESTHYAAHHHTNYVDSILGLLIPRTIISQKQQYADAAHREWLDTEACYTELDARELALLLERTASLSSASGLAPETLEFPLLRDYRQQFSDGKHPNNEYAIVEDDEEDGTYDLDNDTRGGYWGRARAGLKPSKEFLIDTNFRQFLTIFFGVMVGYFIACFDGTIMASSHPVITSYFKSSNSSSWLSTAFLLTSTAVQPMLGRLSDSVGRKPPYLVTMAIFAAATAWCALAGSLTSFIIARAVCGIGAGGMMALGSIIISDLVDIDRRGTYQSYINIIYGLSSASGAALGGLMADTLGWRWEFGIQVPPLIIAFIGLMFVMPDDLGLQGERESLKEAVRHFDFTGSLLLTISTTFLILGLNLGGNILSWSHPFIVISLVIFTISFTVYFWAEAHAKRPIMPLELLNHAPRANIIFSNFLSTILVNAVLFNVPLYFQAVLLTSATESGIRLVVPQVTASAAGAVAGFAISYTRRLKWPLVVGGLASLAGSVVLCCMQRSGWPTWAYLAALIPGAVGQGLQFPGTFIAVLAASDQLEQAVVTSTLGLWRALGSVLGVATSSLILQNALRKYLEAYVHHDAAWKQELIERVRESVAAVAELEGNVLEQVVRSYDAAIRLTFIFCAALATLSLLLILPIRLPKLGSRK